MAPTGEVCVETSGQRPDEMESVFDGLTLSKAAAEWIVDVLVAADVVDGCEGVVRQDRPA